MSDLLPFFRAWVADPRRVSAISPSSPALAEMITSEISPTTGSVLELGPGTGVFTRALIARGLDEGDLTLIEAGAEFARLLADRYPRARVFHTDATRLARSDLYPAHGLGAAISGLPLLSMRPRQVMGVLNGAFRYLGPDGAFYQFTYGPRCPVPSAILDRMGLKSVRIGTIVRNVPPSSVYRISRMS
ncbi:class I SAM-dependent methyltransferase [Thalassospira xiamenensis]|uniref:Phospholipid N-methyltransferase n=1 Tax=Thalassospira xiamenensis TaxID=220697 RepID=A0A154KSH8_9PROT|nr:SAM-dependent methyltransferase [Thalassospira xiamenensis]KZB53023.1 SAM-dependent methyltransferase [Thalassospira xiamenensis]SOC29815.1 Phospholipid N-methyltransferase [Thalassospira xiamenensis]